MIICYVPPLKGTRKLHCTQRSSMNVEYSFRMPPLPRLPIGFRFTFQGRFLLNFWGGISYATMNFRQGPTPYGKRSISSPPEPMPPPKASPKTPVCVAKKMSNMFTKFMVQALGLLATNQSLRFQQNMRTELFVKNGTHPETNSFPLKMDGWKMNFLLGPGLFSRANYEFWGV